MFVPNRGLIHDDFRVMESRLILPQPPTPPAPRLTRHYFRSEAPLQVTLFCLSVCMSVVLSVCLSVCTSSGLKWGRAQTRGPVLYLVHLSKNTKLTNIFKNKVDFTNILYKMHYSGLIFLNALKYGQMHED